MGEADLLREILDRAAQFNGATVGAHIEREKMAHALARGTDVALREPCARTHHLLRQLGGEDLRGLAIPGEGLEQRSFRIDAHIALLAVMASQ